MLRRSKALRNMNMPVIAGLLAISFTAFGQSSQGPANPPQIRPAVTAPAPTAAAKAAVSPSLPLGLTARQIVEKNVAARGGLTAWRAVQSMVETGKMVDTGSDELQRPFVLKMKRPRKSRLELGYPNQIAVQAYDGLSGWKLLPWRNTVQSLTKAELEKAADQLPLDGPLIDYAVKGTKVEYVGIEQVDGQDAYKLKLTLADTKVRHIWIDKQTFLEVKIEADPRAMLGHERQAATYFRDYRSVNGLLIPYELETTIEGIPQTHKVIVENVVLNAKLDDRAFAKPVGIASSQAMGRGTAPPPFGAPPVKR